MNDPVRLPSQSNDTLRPPNLQQPQKVRHPHPSGAPQPPVLSDRVFLRMAHWVRAHIDARIEERDLRDLTAMRPLVFRRAFVARAGMPPLQFVTWTRVDVAVRLLMETRFSVSEIAFVTGLESELGLSRAFRRTLGVGPHALRSG